MCGIVGYIGSRDASQIILDGLTRLEYRGYDSAGIAVLNGTIHIKRSEGKLNRLKELLVNDPLPGVIGIGHTRWATHGRPSEANAHPHRAGSIVVVHNGIIENYLELREELIQQGCEFHSETDTEIVAHLINSDLQKGTPIFEAFQKTLQKIRGSYALVVMDEKDPDHLYVARYQSPLVLGVSENENFVASDVPALFPYTRKVIFLEDGDRAIVSKKNIQVFNSKNEKVDPPIKEISWSLDQAEKGNYKHFMLKEIFETSRAFTDTLRGRINPATGEVFLEGMENIVGAHGHAPLSLNKIYIIACGTSYHAALIGKFYLEEFAKIPVFVDISSEFRYRNPILDSQTLLIAISQSGETADTLVAVKNAKAKGAKILSVCNVVDASIPRESNAVLYTRAGPEIGVAATKTFITQIEALLLIALYFGQKKELSSSQVQRFTQEMSALPLKMEKILKQYPEIQKIAEQFNQSHYFLFIGRGYEYPIALEGALKLKEISYITSEGYPSGELKHGPIAMIDHETPVIALIPKDQSYEKMFSNVQEVLARDAALIAIATEGDEQIAKKAKAVFYVPETLPAFYPLLAAIPLQLLAYKIADLRGHDVDQPRNLAKSVTVE